MYFSPEKRLFTSFIVLLVFCLLQIGLHESNYINPLVTQHDFNSKIANLFDYFTQTKLNKTGEIVVGLVYCRREKLKQNSYFRQTLTLIKSLLISCKLFNLEALELHIFLEYLQDEQDFRKAIKETLYFPYKENEPSVNLTLQFHSAIDPVPEKYREHMIYHPRFRCSYLRFFYEVSQEKKNI